MTAQTRAEKKATDKLSKELIQSANAGYGASYGVWKATQPIQEVKYEAAESVKVCPLCGERFKPKSPKAVYCCNEHQKLAYQRKNRDKRNAYQAELREKRRQQVNTDG